MGGIGKTQLSLAHIQDCTDDYSSIFGFDTEDEISLRRSMTDLREAVFPQSASPIASSADDEKLKVQDRSVAPNLQQL